MNIAIEQAILERLHTFGDTRLTEVLDFVDFITRRYSQISVADETVTPSLRGKYRDLMPSSESFAAHKEEEKMLESEKFYRR